MTTPNFSKKPAAAPQQQQFNMQKLGGGMPIPKAPTYVSPTTANTLKPFGYEDGDPIPEGMAARIAQMQKEIRADEQAYDEANRPTTPTSVRPQKMLKLEDLSDAHKAEITQLLQQAKATGMQPQQHNPAANLPPQVAHAVSHLSSLQQPAESHVVNDLVGATPPNFAKKQPPSQPTTAAPPAPEAPPQPAPEHVHDALTGALPGRYTHCPRCAFDLAMEHTADPDEQDRRTFLVAVLAQDRFRKQLPIMNGELVITYRSLTAAESKLVLQQLSYDLRSGKIAGEGDYWNYLVNYRLCISVERITQRDGRVLQLVPELNKIPYDPPEDGKLETALVPMDEWFTTTVLPQEPLRRVVAQQHRQFQRLVEALEAQVAEPNFWKGIGTQL